MKTLISIQITLPGTVSNYTDIKYRGKYLYVAVSKMKAIRAWEECFFIL